MADALLGICSVNLTSKWKDTEGSQSSQCCF